MTDAAHMPETALENVVAYEEWLKEADGDFEWVAVGEADAAGMCYTSGTTSDPKGARHTDSSIHAIGLAMADRIEEMGDKAARQYIDGMLKAGSKAPPLDILRDAGVDLETPAPIQASAPISRFAVGTSADFAAPQAGL